jgi:hypothetical protein
MSIGGRMIKISACLSSICVYPMSMRLLHKATIEEMDKPTRSFFWAVVQIKENITLLERDGFASQRRKVVWA